MKSLKSLALALLAVAFGALPALLLTAPASAASPQGSRAGRTAGAHSGRVGSGISWTTHLTLAGMRGRETGGPR